MRGFPLDTLIGWLKLISEPRSKRVKSIYEQIGWSYIHEQREQDESNEVIAQNIMSGFIEGIPARIAKITYYYPRTRFSDARYVEGGRQLWLNLSNQFALPFRLRPREWHDSFMHSPIIGKNFIVEGIEEEFILDLFSDEAKSYYETKRSLFIECSDNRLIIFFENSQFKPIKKEHTLNLIAEGKYIAQLIKAAIR